MTAAPVDEMAVINQPLVCDLPTEDMLREDEIRYQTKTNEVNGGRLYSPLGLKGALMGIVLEHRLLVCLACNAVIGTNGFDTHAATCKLRKGYISGSLDDANKAAKLYLDANPWIRDSGGLIEWRENVRVSCGNLLPPIPGICRMSNGFWCLHCSEAWGKLGSARRHDCCKDNSKLLPRQRYMNGPVQKLSKEGAIKSWFRISEPNSGNLAAAPGAAGSADLAVSDELEFYKNLQATVESSRFMQPSEVDMLGKDIIPHWIKQLSWGTILQDNIKTMAEIVSSAGKVKSEPWIAPLQAVLLYCIKDSQQWVAASDIMLKNALGCSSNIEHGFNLQNRWRSILSREAYSVGYSQFLAAAIKCSGNDSLAKCFGLNGYQRACAQRLLSLLVCHSKDILGVQNWDNRDMTSSSQEANTAAIPDSVIDLSAWG
ncbi:hypothetical protein GGF40_004252 [Coemansia sp. RSA 1286]|nr:hypothetical protein GGF40_004252 [Coemansia sp. RSA 1286]